MPEYTFKGKFLIRNLHLLLILIFFIILFLLFAFFGDLKFLLLSIILIPFFLFVLYGTIPQTIKLNNEGIFIFSLSNKQTNKFSWTEITEIEESEFQYRDSILKVFFNFLLYGIFSLYFGSTYHQIKITNIQDDTIIIKDYRIKEYDKFISQLQKFRTR